MKKHEPKICIFCGDLFEPHPKVGPRQLVCGKLKCKLLRIRRTKKRWYDHDPAINYSYVKKSRQNHPDTQRKWRAKKKQQQQAQLRTLQTLPADSELLKVGKRDRAKRGSKRLEIRDQLTLTKTAARLDLVHADEIRNQLSLSITLQLNELLELCNTDQCVR